VCLFLPCVLEMGHIRSFNFFVNFNSVGRLYAILLCLFGNKILAVCYVRLYQKHHRLTLVLFLWDKYLNLSLNIF